MSLDLLRRDIADIPQSADAGDIKRKSRDMTHAFSPVLRDEARSRLVDLVVTPRTKDDVVRIAAAAARHRVPIMARGAGTANWGQGIPMKGGVLLDMTAMTRVVRIADRTLRVEPGIVMAEADRIARRDGLEMRMHPSSRRIATLGGFVAGGHVGIGSCTWGILRDRGNIVGLEVVSIEETPQVVEVRGEAVNRVHHAYGTNGIITELEMPLAPAYRWREAIVDFADFMQAVAFGVTLNGSDGLVVKMVAINAWPYPAFFKLLKHHLRDGRHTVHVMVADEYVEAFQSVVDDFRGTIVYQALEGGGDFGRPLYEFSFGHARFHANSVDPDLVANIGMFPHDDLLPSIERVYARFADLGPLRLDMKRMDGRLTGQGAPLFKFRDAAHMAAIVRAMEAAGLQFDDTLTAHMHDNGIKRLDDAERAFKLRMDPHDLMNPGKFAAVDSAGPR